MFLSVAQSETESQEYLRTSQVAYRRGVNARREQEPEAGRGLRIARVLWLAGYVLALCAVLVAAVQIDPPSRKNRFADAEASVVIGLVAGAVAVVLLVLLQVLPRLRPRTLPTAAFSGWLIWALAAVLTGYRVLVGPGDARGFSDVMLEPLLGLQLVQLVLLGLLAGRLERRRRGELRDGDTSAGI